MHRQGFSYLSAQDAPAAPGGQTDRQGYLLTLELLDGRARFQSAAEIDNYLENKHLTSEDDWLLLFLGAAGERIGSRRISNPNRFSPILSAEQPVPFVAKIPHLTGLATVVLYDQYLSEQLRIPLDGSFRARALANRQAFLAHERENRRLVAEEAKKHSVKARAALLPSRQTTRLEGLPGELQKKIRSEIALAIEQPGLFMARAAEVSALGAEPSWTISGTVLGDGGAPIPSATVLLRQLTFTTTSSPSWTARADSKGRFSLSVTRNLQPPSFILAAYAQNYVLQCVGLEIDRDVAYDFELVRGKTVSGTVRDNAEKALRGVRVQAYQDGYFVASALTDTDGTYDFDLPAGTYDMEALPPVGSTFAPANARGVSIQEPSTIDLALSPARGILSVKLNFPAEGVYNRFASRSLVRFEMFQSGLTVHASSGVPLAAGFDSTGGKFYRTYNLYLSEGKYKLVAFVAGCRPISVPDVTVSGESTLALDLPSPFLWTGVLRGADRSPLAGMTILSYTDLAREYEATATNAAGEFSILLTPNGFVKFYTDAGSNNILHTERIGEVTAARNEDVVLDPFPSFSDSGVPLTQIYGVPDRSTRWNIVMIGDGYTDIAESYTDLNQNGIWDGVIYYDLNKNGVWDTGEPYQRYGNVTAPVSGTNPNLKNEPFTDLNGDGVPNIRDMALFDQNTLDTARSLFGQDEWRAHRDAFNFFRIRLVSRQAGHKIMDKDGKVVLERDTALGTYLNTPDRGYLFNANYSMVTQYINQYVPECDTRIVMVNQPVRMGRVNSYMFQYGGDVPTLCNDYVVAHEMGHNVGRLADEYTEYQEFYRGSESAARNVTSLTDLRYIPWRYLISPEKEIPSIPGSHGVGLYEGAGYYTGGKYRPTEFCMMVSGNRYCPVCTVEIEMRLAEIMGVVPAARLIGPASKVSSLYPEFRWEPLNGVSHFLLEVETADGSQLVASYDIYDTAFVLPFALAGSAEYRWRLRPASAGSWGAWSPWTYFQPKTPDPAYTGVFAQIAAGGNYQTSLTAINVGQADADVTVTFHKSNGTPFRPTQAGDRDLVHLNIRPMGARQVQVEHPGDLMAGYARMTGNLQLAGSALFKTMKGNTVVSEAGVGLAKPSRNFLIYIDNTNDARSGYALVHDGNTRATVNLTLRDTSGNVRDRDSLTLAPGSHLSEFADERFKKTAAAGFEGSIEFSSDQDIAAIALRYDNVNPGGHAQVFSSIPVLADEAATTLYFPQTADGGGYRTNFILMNSNQDPANARLEFYQSNGTLQSFAIGGVERTSFNLALNAKGVAHVLTDCASAGVRIGWAKVTSDKPVFGSAIFQTRAGNSIVSEAGVGASFPGRHLAAYMESLGSAESGLAICNPSSSAVALTLKLRQSSGETVASTDITLPAMGHVAKFFKEWFPRGFAEFGGTLEVVATGAISAIALRYDNPQQDVFATLPVVILP